MPVRLFFFFNDTATTEIYTLSLHDALPISTLIDRELMDAGTQEVGFSAAHLSSGVYFYRIIAQGVDDEDRKSTRLNSSHLVISYAVFCLKKKKTHSRGLSRASALRPTETLP